MDNHFQSIKHFITELVATSPLNQLSTDGGPIFAQPLVGVADGRDPLFAEYKHIIGDFHLTPQEVLQGSVSPEKRQQIGADISVVCWALPFAERIKTSNAAADAWPPSPLWSQATKHGEAFNNHLRKQVTQLLSGRGHIAVAPMHSPLWNKPHRYISNWSERHALYAAGLGTFSLTRALITERGVAMRCGSVVVNARLAPTPRHYTSHTENCLFYADGSCGVCIDRCPANAITTDGHDKVQCREYRDRVFESLVERDGLETEPDGCGLCQTGVPCESRIPNAKR
jgi:epoxyqueuosine reductase QueG